MVDKLYSVSLNQHALLWFNAYLHNRCQCVSFHGSQSDYLIVEKGVPQGSTLGPLVFLSSLKTYHIYVLILLSIFILMTLFYTPPTPIYHKSRTIYSLILTWFRNGFTITDFY